MAKTSLVGGTTSYIATVFIQDSTSTTGAGKTGLAFNTASLTAYYVRPGAAATSITLATQTATGAYSSGGFVEIDATNMPGFYRFDVPNAVLAAGVKSAAILLKGAAGMAPLALEFEVTGTDNQDATAGGISRIDAAISTRSTYAGADTSGTTTLLGRIPGTVQPQTGDSFARLGAPAGASHAADVAAVKSDTAAVKVQTDKLTFTVANQIDSNVLDWKSSAAPAMTGDAFARLGAPAGASVSADVAAVKSDTGGLRTDYTTARAGYLDVLNGIVAAIWAAATRTLTAVAGLTAQQVANAVWDEPTASHQTAGSTGKALTSASSAGDPWATQLPGSYAAGTAGRIVGGTPNTYAQQGAGDTPFVGR